MKKKLSPPAQSHRAVLKSELLQMVISDEARVCIDATFGAGDHSRAVLEQMMGKGRLIGIDRDECAIAAARVNFTTELQTQRLHLQHACFSQLPSIVDRLGLQGKIDCLYADLGFSATQMLDPTRGFSIQHDGELDMRLSQRTQQLTAAELVNTCSQEELTHILHTYGEEPHAARIARHLVQARTHRPITRTSQLAALIAAVTAHRNHRLHPATRVFQALRIAVNDELGELRQLLNAATFALLRTGGRMAIISFHSLEDRLVKRSFRALTTPPHAALPRSLPLTAATSTPPARLLKPFPVQPRAQEIYNNRRARSAKLRGIEKIS